MSLLEAVVALVILGVVGIASLGVVQTASRSAHDGDVWMDAVATAEAAMEASKLTSAAAEGLRADVQRATVVRRPWPGGAGLEEVTVTVALPEGGQFVIKRLEYTR